MKTQLTNDYSTTLQKMYNFYSKLTTNITLKEIDSYAEMILNYSIDNNEYYTLPFIDLKTEYYDLGLEHRNETNDQVTFDSAEATKK